MLRADNITCITVMLDPPGPPFSECILNKKKQLSDTSDMDQSTGQTPQRPKLLGQCKEQILNSISNELTPTRVIHKKKD